MKKLFCLFFILIAVLFQGCIVKSLQPFYKESNLVFRTELLNVWVDDEGNKWELKPVDEKNPLGSGSGTPISDVPKAYEMIYTNDGHSAVFLVHLFRLNDQLYVDFFPVEKDPEAPIFDVHLLPSHSVAKVEILNADEVRIKWFNEKWLKTLFEQNRIRIARETVFDAIGIGTYVLTAPTEDLQKFIVKYGHEDAQFDDDNTVRLNLKRSL